MSYETALVRSRAYLEVVLENIESGVVLLDSDRRIVFTNRAFEKVSNVPRQEAIGMDRQEFLRRCASLFGDFEGAVQGLTPDEASKQSLSGEVELHHPARRVLRWRSRVVPLPEGDGRLDIYRDVTREADLTRALKEQAGHDPLTGLLNRRGGDEALVAELARAQREGKSLATMLVDIDHFKRVNDQHGHAVGDQVLQVVARALTASVRPYDIVVRWGGEEMLVVAPGVDTASAHSIAERMRAAVEACRVPGLPEVTVSVGLDCMGPDEPDIGGSIRRADARLYEAKRSGRNRVR